MAERHVLCCDCLDCLGAGPAPAALEPESDVVSVTELGRQLEREHRASYVPTGRPVGRPRKQVARE